jgi:protocatechuate 3,4-dioxygenase beta subunit
MSDDRSFHIGNLQPGIYHVRLDNEHLPIELVPDGKSLWVKVAHGAVTRVDFSAQLQFGVAGRVTREDGSFVARSKLWILDEDGNTRLSTYTDQFGLYRADGLTPGRYRVEAVGDDKETVAAATEFTISDDFLFGIDLTLLEPTEI